MKVTVVLSPEPDSEWFSVTAPSMPEAISQGASRTEALENIAESITLWLNGTGSAAGVPSEETVERIAAEVASVLADRTDLGWDLRIETAVIDVPVPANAT